MGRADPMTSWAIYNFETDRCLKHAKSQTTWTFPTREAAAAEAKRLMQAGRRTLDGKLMLRRWNPKIHDWMAPEKIDIDA